ncbi:hypothetical protein [Xanthomarina gelatinilytica]|uniref:hypothetical protein n=1 Tax=Xanthomarina gelatinilytica TaxID=1137281 RepID=UPI003AA96D4A
MLIDNIFNPYYNKRNGVKLGFILSAFFCSRIDEIERKIIYIFYIANIIPHEFLKNKRAKIDKEFLLKLIFELSNNKKYISKKDLRALTGLEEKKTFNKYFDVHLDKLGLSNNRAFTLSETFKILQFWQGDDKWGRMEAFSKGELANRFMNGNYDDLEIKMTDEVLNYAIYSHHDFIKPADAKKFINKVLDKDTLELLYEEEFSLDYLSYFFIIYIVYTSIPKKQ